MWHVSIHDTTDTPPHTPAHTRLLEHTPPSNKLWALAFKKSTNDQHIHFRLSSGGQHLHGEASPQAKRLPPTPAVFLTAAAGRHPHSRRDYNKSPLRYTIVQDEFDYDHDHQAQWHELCTMGYRDGPSSRTEATVWYHQSIRRQAGRASSKRDRYGEGPIQRLDESPWCCQIDCPARHGTQDTSEIHGRRRCEDTLGKASISLQVKAEAQHLRD